MTKRNAGLYDPIYNYREMMITRHIMEIVHVAAVEAVGAYTLHSMRLEEVPQLCDKIAFRLSANIAAEALKPQDKTACTVQLDIDIPGGWWQTFKQDYFPAWLLRRFPVKTKVLQVDKRVDVEVLATYPMLSTVFPPGENRPVIKVFAQDAEAGTCVVKVTKELKHLTGADPVGEEGEG